MTQRHLLTTKIQVPPLPPKTVQRTRLLETLDRGLQPNFRLTLLSAPAGYGKTTLLNAWVQDRVFPTAWLSLDEGDNDPIRFMSYLLAALESGIPALDIPSPVEEQFSEGEIQERILIPLINQMGQSPRQTLIVLDDYHFIHNQTVHDRMGYLIDRLPPQAHDDFFRCLAFAICRQHAARPPGAVMWSRSAFGVDHGYCSPAL